MIGKPAPRPPATARPRQVSGRLCFLDRDGRPRRVQIRDAGDPSTIVDLFSDLLEQEVVWEGATR